MRYGPYGLVGFFFLVKRSENGIRKRLWIGPDLKPAYVNVVRIVGVLGGPADPDSAPTASIHVGIGRPLNSGFGRPLSE